MSIDEAIRHCLAVADGQTEQGRCPECAEDHRQLAEWLTDYKRLLERESCENAISKEVALDAISRIGLHKSGTNEVKAVVECLRAVETLPPVNPQKAGHWIKWYETIDTDICTNYIPHCKCSECGKEYDPHSSQFIKYCNECGARMLEPQEGSGEE